jgi:flavin prenyltransferase
MSTTAPSVSEPLPNCDMPRAPRRLPVVVGLTGASGAALGLRLLQELLTLDCPVDLIPSDKALLVMAEETGFKPGALPLAHRSLALCQWLKLPEDKATLLSWYNPRDIGAKPASGTYLCAGMVVVPCSMGTMAKIAAGLSDSLLTRAADVTLKEHRPLLLVPRETPLNAIHLENMLKLSRLGVRMIPPMLAFYSQEFNSIEGQLRYTTGKVLDQLGLTHSLHQRWEGMGTHPAESSTPAATTSDTAES